ncbi:uncharacterized protein LOC143021332 [Oratosquilla oratoria]|uniref:uncharacterized protein LOC143021332 n=1 Tax=Oratosquilla oratoria TaxID=337810 RepID=UPI003F761311
MLSLGREGQTCMKPEDRKRKFVNQEEPEEPRCHQDTSKRVKENYSKNYEGNTRVLSLLRTTFVIPFRIKQLVPSRERSFSSHLPASSRRMGSPAATEEYVVQNLDRNFRRFLELSQTAFRGQHLVDVEACLTHPSDTWLKGDPVVGQPRLTLGHLLQILDESWLDDTVIDAAMATLTRQFPNLRPTNSCRVALYWPPLETSDTRIVQVVNTMKPETEVTKPIKTINVSKNEVVKTEINNSVTPDVPGKHWVAISNLKAPSGSFDVFVYDSLAGQCSQNVKDIVWNLNGGRGAVRRVQVQHQEDSHSCGPLAIANCVSLAFGRDPEGQEYVMQELRPHLAVCLSLGVFKPFPVMVGQKTNEKIQVNKRHSRDMQKHTRSNGEVDWSWQVEWIREEWTRQQIKKLKPVQSSRGTSLQSEEEGLLSWFFRLRQSIARSFKRLE